ncbi:hypothetical protein BOX15_Mlig021339g2 [Macrostomum lignano]|uniref:Uncharacterized protein n=1 Tax=Macrostomum lignano TaxID=282301 RepID=A0A267E9A3_9PLAT|nr:hypothetical protein BOX15_Mlig021339g2 [Macrostomum lignano]
MKPLLLTALLLLGLAAAASAFAASPADAEGSAATEEIANDLESVDNPDELEKSEYAPESEEELETKRSPAPDLEPTASRQRRIESSSRSRRTRRFLQRILDASPAAAEDSAATEEIGNDLGSVDKPNELEESEYAPESEELEAKRSPAPDREPTARPQRRVKSSNSAASPAAPVEDSEATEEIANELESVDNPDELEKSEYAPESEELETKRSPAPDREPTASPKRRVRSSRLRRILSFFRRASWRSRRGSGSKSTAMSDSAAEWRRRRGRRFRGRLIRRLRSLADLLDGLNRTTVGCSTVDESQRRSLGRWARRLKPFLLPRKNSTAPIEAEPRSPEAVEEAVNDDSAE